MTEADKKKLTIEVLRDKDDWLENPPLLSVEEEGREEPTIYGKSPLGRLSIGIQEINIAEGIEKYPPSEDSWGVSTRIYGEGCLSGISLGRVIGDDIGFFGGERTDRISVEITCESYKPDQEERRKIIEKKGIDTSEHDYINLFGSRPNLYLQIKLRNQIEFDELLRKIRVREITTLGITIHELDKVAGLYRPEYDYEPDLDLIAGQSFYLLGDSKKISNLTNEELETIPNQLHFDSYYWQLTTNYSVVDFYISFNPPWVTSELFDEDDQDDDDDFYKLDNSAEESNKESIKLLRKEARESLEESKRTNKILILICWFFILSLMFQALALI